MQRRPRRRLTTVRARAGSGGTGPGGDRGRGRAGSASRRHVRPSARPPAGGGEKLLLNFPTPGPRADGGGRGDARRSWGAGGPAPGPSAARPGSAAAAASLPAVRPHSHGSPQGDGDRPRRTPAGWGPLSVLHLLLAGCAGAATTAPPARDAFLEEEGTPGRPHPSPPSLLLSPPAPPLRSRRGRTRAGLGLRLPARARSPELAPCTLLGAPSGARALRGVRGRRRGRAGSRLPAQHGAGARAGS